MKSITAEERADRQQFRKDYPMCEAAIKTSQKNIHQAFLKDEFYDVKCLKDEFLKVLGLSSRDYNVVITCENGFDKNSPNKYICRNHNHYKVIPKITPQMKKFEREKEELNAKIAALKSDLAYAESRNLKLENRNAQLQFAFVNMQRQTERIAEIFCENEVEI